MRDWLKAFRPASFRGVPFKVDVENASGGRRLSIHPIAYADTSVIEDMGRDPHRYSVTAYVVGDRADGAALALAAALATKGAGTLVLPMQGALAARVVTWSWSRYKDYAGHVGIDIEFVEEGLAGVPFVAMAGAGALAALFSDGAAAIGAALARITKGLTAGDLAGDLDDAADAVDNARMIAALSAPDGAPATDLETALSALSAAAPELRADPQGWAAAIAEAWRLIAIRSDATSLRQELSPIPEAAGTAAMAVTRCFSAAALAIATVRDDYAAQADASAARTTLAEVSEPVMADVAAWLGGEAAAWIASLTGEAALMVSAGQASRAPLVMVETPFSISAIRAAYDLYGDGTRAGEILTRNGGGDPVFLPVRFEALAP